LSFISALRRLVLRRSSSVFWNSICGCNASVTLIWTSVRRLTSGRSASVWMICVVRRPDSSLALVWHSESASRHSASVFQYRVLWRL
jgi:hypothetical protein